MSVAAAASIRHWDNAQVAYYPETVTAEQSLASMQRRNDMYPGLLELMPIDLPGKVIMDFGCGPGHDTIGFLLHGAAHVFAVDSSIQGLTSLAYRLHAHGFEDRCTLIRIGTHPPLRMDISIDHIHCAGVLHHIEDPVETLRFFHDMIEPGHQEIRLMVYDAESEYVRNVGGPEAFELIADGPAPIAKAWTHDEIELMASRVGLSATYLGGYLMSETSGPVGGCWSLR